MLRPLRPPKLGVARSNRARVTPESYPLPRCFRFREHLGSEARGSLSVNRPYARDLELAPEWSRDPVEPLLRPRPLLPVLVRVPLRAAQVGGELLVEDVEVHLVVELERATVEVGGTDRCEGVVDDQHFAVQHRRLI